MNYLKLVLMAFMVMLGGVLYSQEVSESVVSYKDVFNPIFSKETSVLQMDLVKQYSVGSKDTVYSFVMDLQKDMMELSGVSLGASVFNSGLATGVASSYKRKEESGNIILNKEEFLEFYACIKEVHSFISKYEAFNKSANNIVASCDVNNLLMGGEYDVSKGVKYYFKVGDNATYGMTTEQFHSVVKILKEMKGYWG